MLAGGLRGGAEDICRGQRDGRWGDSRSLDGGPGTESGRKWRERLSKRYVKCFYETNFFRMRPGSFIKELILEASSCLVKLESARRKGETEGREGGTFQAEGMKPAREPCR